MTNLCKARLVENHHHLTLLGEVSGSPGDMLRNMRRLTKVAATSHNHLAWTNHKKTRRRGNLEWEAMAG
jgi:hypothetical protein